MKMLSGMKFKKKNILVAFSLSLSHTDGQIDDGQAGGWTIWWINNKTDDWRDRKRGQRETGMHMHGQTDGQTVWTDRQIDRWCFY